MKEQFSSNAIVIGMDPISENNQLVYFLTENDGLLRATLYGGRKSHLKNYILQWNSGILTYTKSKKDFLTVIDFDVNNFHNSITDNITKLRLATACQEIVINTKSIATGEDYWKWVIGFINGLDLCTTKYGCVTAFLRFVWRYLYLMGMQPDITTCANCKKSIFNNTCALDSSNTDNINVNNQTADNFDFVLYNKSEHEFLCSNCATQCEDPNTVRLSITAASYLNSIMNCDYKTTQTTKLSNDVILELYNFLIFLIEEACEKPIYAIQSLKIL